MIFYAHFLLWYIQQCKLRLPPFEQHGVAFSLVVAEGDILPVDVPVARLQLSDQRAFGYLSAPQKPVWSDIVGKRGKQKTVFSELPEHRAEVPHVFPQECVSLPLCHGSCRIPFARQQAFPSASPQNTSCSAPPARKVAAGRLPPARPFPLGG